MEVEKSGDVMLKHNLRGGRLFFSWSLLRNAIALLALIVLEVVPVNADEERAERLPITVGGARFQALPREVRRVCVGPDGRTWFRLDPPPTAGPAGADSVPAFKKRIAREFSERSPQFFGAELALFEPGGRVWFFLPQQCLLLGYDGKSWIDHVIPDAHDRVVGYCPTRGTCLGGRANRFAQDAAWFVCARGVLRFDGQNWLHQRLSEQPSQNPAAILLTASRDGRAVAVCQMETSTNAPPKYWLYEKGQWLSQSVPADDPQNPGANRRIVSLAFGDRRALWLVFNNGQLECANLGGDDAPRDAKELDDLIRQLGDDSYAARQRATRELQSMGPPIKPQLEEALKQNLDPEQQYRLKRILESFQPRPAAPGTAPSTQFGGVQVMFARQLFQDPAGRVGVIAQMLRDAQSREGPGVALLDDQKKAKAIFSQKLVIGGFNFFNENLPIAAASERYAWWPRILAGDAVQLYDAQIDEFINAAPMPLFGNLLAVSAEGSVFLAKNAAGNPNEPIMVYTPSAPETRTVLRMEKHPVQFPQYAVTDDGAVWLMEREDAPAQPALPPQAGGNWGGRLVRFNGKDWQTLETQPSQAVQSMTPGRGGVLLVQGQAESILFRGEKAIDSGDLVELIEKNREVFQKSFGADAPRFSSYDLNARQSSQVVADKAGNIWRLEEGGRLLVLMGERWELAHAALVAAGSSAGVIAQIVPVGDGGKIYVMDRGGTPGRPRAFFGEVKDGKLSFVEAPKIESRGSESSRIRDAEGNLWTRGALRDSKGDSRLQIVCLGAEGVREKLDFVGVPKLVDQAGTLWVEKNVGATAAYKLWRKGEWVQELTAPRGVRNLPVFSDRPGSAYVWTAEGLQQFVAEPPEFKSYRAGELLSIDNLSGEILTLTCTKQGLLVLLMQGGADTSPWTLGLLKLPDR
jgi:hypothetical protein